MLSVNRLGEKFGCLKGLAKVHKNLIVSPPS